MHLHPLHPPTAWLWHCTRREIIQHEALFPHFLYEFFQLTYLFFIKFLNLTLITMIVNSLTAAQFGLDNISDRVCSLPLVIDLHSVLNNVNVCKWLLWSVFKEKVLYQCLLLLVHKITLERVSINNFNPVLLITSHFDHESRTVDTIPGYRRVP